MLIMREDKEMVTNMLQQVVFLKQLVCNNGQFKWLLNIVKRSSDVHQKWECINMGSELCVCLTMSIGMKLCHVNTISSSSPSIKPPEGRECLPSSTAFLREKLNTRKNDNKRDTGLSHDPLS